MKFGLANLSIVVGIAMAALAHSVEASEIGDLKYQADGRPEDRAIHYNPSFIASQNIFEARRDFGLLGFDEETAYYAQRNADAKNAIRLMGSEQFKKVVDRVRNVIELNAGQVVRDVAMVAATGAAIYSGQTFKFNLGGDLLLSTRAAFNTREGYFATLSRGSMGLLVNRAMASTDQALGAFAMIPALQVNSQVTVNDTGSVQSTLSKNVASGLDVSVGQAVGGRVPANSQVKMGYGLNF